MNIIFVLFAILCFAVLVAQESNKEYGSPLISLTEFDPWAMVIGSDTPTFTLYESGVIICYDFENKRYVSVKLTEEEKNSFINDLNISDSLLNLPEYINTSDWTDQPQNELILNLDTKKSITVYGSTKDDKESRENTPREFLEIFDKLVDYKNEKAEFWLPEKIEVMAWDYSYSVGKPLKWPEGWPDLNDNATINRDNLYSIYLDKIHYDDLINLLKQRGEKQSIKINGKKFAVSFRLPFPNM